MKRVKWAKVLAALAFAVLLVAVGAFLVTRMIGGVMRFGEMPVEPVVRDAADPDDAAWDGWTDAGDGDGGIGRAVGSGMDDDMDGDWDDGWDGGWDDGWDGESGADGAPAQSPAPMVQVPVIETPEQLAGEG